MPAQMLAPISPTIRAQQLKSGPTILVVALRPGQEDFNGLAMLRTTSGARLSFLYMTNGESVPSETGPWSQPIVAARRKEEARRTSIAFDGHAFFLNIPDVGLDSVSMEHAWRADSLTARMTRIVATVKPHLILLCTGADVTPAHVQGSLIASAVRSAADQCAKGFPDVRSSWRVQCIAEAHHAAEQGAMSLTAAKTKETAEAKRLAATARSMYASLLLQPSHEQAPDRVHYRIIEQEAGNHPSRFILDGIHVSSPELRAVAQSVQRAGESLLSGATARARQSVAAAEESVSVHLQRGLKNYSELDQRALILWKGDLDYLHAKAAERYVDIQVSDSILTERQVFFLSVRFLRQELKSGINQLIFHKSKNEDWGFNETKTTIFDLNRDSIFRVLTPEHLSFNTPVALYGLGRTTLDDPFRFSIVHRGKSDAKSFIMTKEVTLRYSSRHASVVQTPVVPIAEGSRVIVDSYNFTRDPVDGAFFVNDSLCASDTVRFSLNDKDEHRTDTLHLRWASGSSIAEYKGRIGAGKRPIGTFIGRSLTMPSLGGKRIVLVSDRAASPLIEYFAMAGLHVSITPSRRITDALLSNTDVLMIDRDTQLDDFGHGASFVQWIRDGGRVIVLPQFSGSPARLFSPDTVAFRPTDLIQSNALKAVPEYQASLSAPIDGSKDANGAASAESVASADGVVRGVIDVPASSQYEKLITTVDGKPVLVRKALGKGMVIVFSIDLDAWIGQRLPAGYAIFAKIVSAP
ncbi:MAG TPA: PIG-L family deacetylase [Bacteroidota bacterium]|nr:PIG-L family deacetylase [Bacteroidota bacterium]